MSPPRGRHVSIDGDDMMLAPGALIRDLNNRIVLPSSLRRSFTVRYTLDRNRQVAQVWILAVEP